MSSSSSWPQQSLRIGVPCLLTTGLALLIRKGKIQPYLECMRNRLGLSTSKSSSTNDSGGEDVVYSDPNFPLTADGRVHHLNVKKGEVANRILSVGDHGRAERLSKFLDNVTVIPSSRGFKTFTGLYRGVPVSIIATGMGIPMMDFVVRETRAIVDGEMAMIRYGTSGGLQDVLPGRVVVASEGAIQVLRDPDGVHNRVSSQNEPYRISQPAKPDKDLSEQYIKCLKKMIPEEYGVTEGMNATADSFYSSQGRTTVLFDDKNSTLLSDIERKYPTVKSLEMETFQLFELAASSYGSIKATAAAIPLSNRVSRKVVSTKGLRELEFRGGEAALQALVQSPLQGAMKGDHCVWS